MYEIINLAAKLRGKTLTLAHMLGNIYTEPDHEELRKKLFAVSNDLEKLLAGFARDAAR